MEPFRVWVRLSGSDCRLQVEEIKNAQWLLRRLSQSFVFKTSDAMRVEPGASCTFHVAYSSHTPQRALEKLLGSIPEVNLIPV